MQIAVAGVEHVGDAQAVVRRQFADALEHLRQPRPRDGAVHAVVVGRDAPDRRERCLASGPEQQPLLLGRRYLAGDGLAVARNSLDARDQVIDLGLRAVEFDDQERLDVERIAGVHEFLGGVDRGLVHHLHAAGNDAGTDDARDTVAGILRPHEADQHRARGLRLLEDAHGDLGDDTEQPFRAGNDPEQVVAAGVEMLAADAHDLAGHQHQFAAEQIVGGHAVFQAVHAAGILRHVAADGAGDLRGRVGRVVETGVLHRLGDGEIGHAGLRHHHAVVEVDLADAVELGHAEQHAVGERQRPARERGPGAARHDFDPLAVAIGQDAADLVGALRQHDHHRQRPVGGQAVGLVGAHRALGGDHALARHDRRERRDDAVAASEHRGVQFRHRNRHRRHSVEQAWL